MSEGKKNIITLAVAVVFSLLVIEGMLRLFETQTYVALWQVNKDNMVVLKPNLDKNIFDNEDLKYHHVKINSLGFLGEDVNQEKPIDTLRIAVMGDSYVAATGVDFDKTFPYLLTKKVQDLLATATSSAYKKVEVLNFGMGGTGTVDEMKYYEKYAQKYNPDVVVLSFYLQNDTVDNSLNYEHRDAMLSSKEQWSTFPQYGSTQVKSFVSIKDKVYRKSAIVRFVDRVVRSSPKLSGLAVKLGLHRPPVKGESGLDIPFDDYYYIEPLDSQRAEYLKFSSDLLNNFKKQLDTDGVKFAIMFIPEGKTINDDLINAFKNTYPKLKDFNFNPKGMENKLISAVDPSVKVLNLRETMTKQVSENKEMYKNGTGHFAEGGHEVASDALANFIFDSFFK
ncbi:MAG: hypothetical protein A2534_05050 [Candidatus Magasanikbacteria bacterium RIFOXYD2_FULL_39_9]|uniref:SGNH hydrolase-type esterase domain-containing protein n=1 Tax=Candidatus Magasanikbacteria bacterium RIFOXYD1_FULL_40_23 TaxID=1798705 RepID=A0A1F6P9M2_9BACT|nr:MAG: hypothetical protein A2534_05050 [Candidatus Magasanikbacteria bacterium RIFOXYD2_FULL_39_9]OGH92869.1 MAG: hypothetical protein A2563_04355 [Candidatus Magasanikbacteria bacterium RIFOXYD1_FULL_40_23]